MDTMKYLAKVDLFQGLSEEELQRLQLDMTIPLYTHKKGTIIAAPHLPAKALYFVKSGKVRLYRLTEEGKELTLDVLRTGHLFGELTSFRAGASMFAIASEDSIICEMDREQLGKVIRAKPELALAYMDIMARRLREVEEWLAYMAYGSIRRRLLFLLDKLVMKFGSEDTTATGWVKLETEITHQELASMTGSIRETVTHELSQLIGLGILRREHSRGSYWIHRTRLLEELVLSEQV